MKNTFKYLFMLIIVVATGCQTTKINNVKYTVSAATTELGSIGSSTTLFKLDNDFKTHSFPLLKNNIRLDVQVRPFNKNTYKIYTVKAELAQEQQKIQYTDSLPVKPELVTISLLDVKGYINELNSDYNKDIATYLKDTEDAVVVTGLALTLPKEALNKIKTSDAYYLTNSQDKKYTLSLYKTGKKTDEIDLTQGTVIGYTLGKFCWAVNARQKWYIGDIVKDNKSCKGETKEKIKEKEQTNLFKM
ncbi:hypothetical protein GWA97_03635 [Flavobacterium sp. LaA7.5]|nr:hypothetical protein [Flavobacterium salilacus subsp. altitudinum]